MEPIGIIKSPIREGRDDGWGEVVSELHVTPAFAAGLEGLDQFSHALVIYWMHASSFTPDNDLVRRPRGRADMPELGIFAQRAKDRPNPLGITVVKLVSVEPDGLTVRGLDAIDGTPVLDLKPHFPVFDSPAGAKVAPWVEVLMRGYF